MKDLTGKTRKPLRVAVADDERDMREFMQELLPRLGHEVVAVAETGAQLAEQVQAFRPDLVITDIKMPDMDGIETSLAVNRDLQVPVILISAHHDAETLTRVGADHIMGYLVKPVTEADVKAAIALAMTRFDQFLALRREATDLRQALDDRKVIEKAKGVLMKRLRVDEEEAFRRMRKLASDRNQKLVEVGRIIIAAEEVFHHLDRS